MSGTKFLSTLIDSSGGGGGATVKISETVLSSTFTTNATSLTLVTGFDITTESSGSFICSYNGSSNGASASDTIYFAIKFNGTIVNQIWCYSDIAGTWNVNPAMTYFGTSDGNDIEGYIQSMSGSNVSLIGNGATGISSSFRVMDIA